MKKLEYTISINAPAEKVWTTMLTHDTYQEWTGVSWPGSLYKGSWKQGENIRFIGANGSGTLATITTCDPYKQITAEHIAVLLEGGVEDKESDMAKGWVGTKESYFFIAVKNSTRLNVEMFINPAWEKMFNDGWPGALAKLKEICER